MARPHLVFIPSAGMGHLFQSSRVMAAVASASAGGLDISVVTGHPTVSQAEAEHYDGLFAASPAIRRIVWNLVQLDSSDFPGSDPFFLQWESLRRSAHLLGPLLADAGASAVVTDVSLASSVIPVVKEELKIPCHVLFVSSAAMLALCAYMPTYLEGTPTGDHIAGDIHIPGVGLFPVDYPPKPLRNPDSLFTKQFIANGRSFADADGILTTTFDALEPDTLAALRSGKVVPGFPPVYTVGPLETTGRSHNENDGTIAWLDGQAPRSVVFVAFGNRFAAAGEQLREIGAGLEASGCPFLWLVKTAVVDRDDTAKLSDVLGDGFLARVEGRGLVTKEWVDQEAVLKHPAVGLHLTHCGWNSVNESVMYGVPMLVWPSMGDQRMIATAVKKGGFGLWVEHWNWDEGSLVRGEEIAEKVKLVIADEAISAKAAEFREEATKAIAVGGSSYRSMHQFLATLKATTGA